MKQFLPKMLVLLCSAGLLTGCHHQPKSIAQQAPLQAQAPAVTEPAAHSVAMEPIPLEPEKANTTAATVPAPDVTTLPPATKPEKHRKSTKPQSTPPAPAPVPTSATTAPVPAPTPAPATQTPPPTAPTTTAATTTRANPANSPIGQLTEGDTSGSAQVQEETEKLIKTTESGLAGLQRTLSAQEQDTAKQIRKFIEQAREALAAQDAGGAKTLAVKANLLLAELKK